MTTSLLLIAPTLRKNLPFITSGINSLQTCRYYGADSPSPPPLSSSPPKPYSSIPKKKTSQIYMDFFRFRTNPQDATYKDYQALGPIYRLKAPSFPEMVMSCDPNDLEIAVRAEGKWPLRIGIPPWRDFRKKMNIPIGVFLSPLLHQFDYTKDDAIVFNPLRQEYEEWHRQRKPMSQFMMVPRKVGEYQLDFNNITDDLIHAIKVLRDPNTDTVNDVPGLLFKWSFESVSFFVLGKRLGALNIDNVPQECQYFIKSIQDLFSSTQTLLFGFPFHKIFRTKASKMLDKSAMDVYYTAMKFVQEKIAEIKEKENNLDTTSEESQEVPEKVDFLTYMLHRDELSLEEVSTAAVDLLGAGVDTTSYTLAWTLYCLATNIEVQSKLRNEVMSVIGNDDIVTTEHIHNLPYLRHCIKEAMRMYPIVANSAKILSKDVVLSGYTIPKETLIVSPTYTMGRLPNLFPEPLIYRPERWNRLSDTATPHLFASLPFGFGPRMCVGRRVAELELNIALARIIKTFNVSYNDSQPVGVTMKLFLVPNKQMDLTFTNI